MNPFEVAGEVGVVRDERLLGAQDHPAAVVKLAQTEGVLGGEDFFESPEHVGAEHTGESPAPGDNCISKE